MSNQEHSKPFAIYVSKFIIVPTVVVVVGIMLFGNRSSIADASKPPPPSQRYRTEESLREIADEVIGKEFMVPDGIYQEFSIAFPSEPTRKSFSTEINGIFYDVEVFTYIDKVDSVTYLFELYKSKENIRDGMFSKVSLSGIIDLVKDDMREDGSIMFDKYKVNTNIDTVSFYLRGFKKVGPSKIRFFHFMKVMYGYNSFVAASTLPVMGNHNAFNKSKYFLNSLSWDKTVTKP